MNADGLAERMTREPAARCIFRFALPLMFGNLFQQVYTFADTVVVGQKLGMNALAALGSTEWMVFLAFGAIQGMTGGFCVAAAQAYGGKSFRKLGCAVFNAGMLSVIMAGIFAAVGQTMIGSLVTILGTPGEIREMAGLYLKWLYAGIPVTFAYHLGAAVLCALGDSRTPFWAIALASMWNILLDLCLVMLFDFGIAGAAGATVISQLLAAGFCWKRIAEEPALKGHWRSGPEWRMAKEQLQLGLSMAFQSMITAFGGLVVQSAVNSFGVVFVAGYTAANKLYGLLETAASSYGYAVVTFVGQNVGARRSERIRQGMRSAAVLGCLTAVLMSAVMLFGGTGILKCFLSGETATVVQSLKIGTRFLRVLAAFFPFLYLLYILRAGIQGLGNGLIPMLSSAMQLIMRVGCALFLTRLMGCAALFWGEAAAWLGADLLLLLFWKRTYLHVVSSMKGEL